MVSVADLNCVRLRQIKLRLEEPVIFAAVAAPIPPGIQRSYRASDSSNGLKRRLRTNWQFDVNDCDILG